LDGWQDPTWTIWVLGALGAFVIGLSKTGVPGIGILAVVMLANVFPARESTGIVLPLLICGDVLAVMTYHYHALWRHLWRLFPWTVLGVLIGWQTLGFLQDKAVARLIGGIVFVLILVQFWRRYRIQRLRREGHEVDDEPPHGLLFAAFTGVLAGFTTLVANAAGPIMIIYLVSMRLPKMEFIGTTAWFFMLLNLFKVPFMVDLHLINSLSLAVTLRFALFVVAGGLVGRVVLKRIDQRLFETLALVLSLAAALRLLW
jgi:uncharacterized membrane protein YfcA